MFVFFNCLSLPVRLHARPEVFLFRLHSVTLFLGLLACMRAARERRMNGWEEVQMRADLIRWKESLVIAVYRESARRTGDHSGDRISF